MGNQSSGLMKAVEKSMHNAVKGQDHAVRRLVQSLPVERGHVLQMGVPGLAKSMITEALAVATGLDNNRIQFHVAMMPTNVTGGLVIDPRSDTGMRIKWGPARTRLLHADEIDRTHPDALATLLQAMQERQITIDGRTEVLHRLYKMVGTQNGIELEGTYPLPEAQIDRFMMRIILDYPDREAEREMAAMGEINVRELVEPAISETDVDFMHKELQEILVVPSYRDYAVDLVRMTREAKGNLPDELADAIKLPASPRATQAILAMARAVALYEDRPYVLPKDIDDVLFDVLNHRVHVTYVHQGDEIAIKRDIIDAVRESVRTPNVDEEELLKTYAHN